ncbi:OmpA family protein [Joostella atrarenae]|uniref:OmpA family protein n=1 Tax=Joostella atrarenae TaxID=679257 RepID=A0ABS9J7P5_9FLAO|nr:OmpA family protein [Joostella atrarenae]MCF8716449.1 OmpA family protein [Joostella atrarenae]
MKKIYIILSVIVFNFSGYSQEKSRIAEKGFKDYHDLSFVDAGKHFKKAADKGYDSAELYRKWANAQFFNAHYDDAVLGYTELFAVQTRGLKAIDYLRFSQALRATDRNEEAEKYYNLYLTKVAETQKGDYSLEDYLLMISENSDRYEISALTELNTAKTEYGASLFKNNFIFTSNRDSVGVVNYTDSWTNDKFLNLYTVKMKIENGDAVISGDVERVKGGINSLNSHTTSACFTRDGNTMYFTKSSGNSKKDSYNVLKIYRASLKNGKWTDIEELPINGDNFSTAHPALSPAEDRLYFSSDRPESIGGTDIFYAPIYNGKKIGRVTTIDANINTYGRESFPFVTDKDELYFSSDGHFGMGGYDIYYTKKGKNGFGNVLNIGKPINTPGDDFAFYIDTESKRGFVSSNNSSNSDDIYSIYELKPIKDVFVSRIEGHVFEENEQNNISTSRKPLANAMIYLLDDNDIVLDSVSSDVNGAYSFNTNRFKNYTIEATKNSQEIKDEYGGIKIIGFLNEKIVIEKGNEVNSLEDIVLLKTGTDLFTSLKLKPILFDYNSAVIRADAAVELDRIVSYLMEHPEIEKISIRSHTDSRGKSSYNLQLSERRAKSTYDYIISEGISKDRLSYKGFGESKLLNRCSDGVSCLESEHQENRRSEFIVEKIKSE